METGVHYQPHAHLHTVVPKVQFLQTTKVAQLHIVVILVVTHTVLVCKKRLASILSSSDTSLYTIAKGILITEVVAILIAQIAVSIALTLIEWNLTCRCHAVLPIFQQVSSFGPY